MNIDQEIAEAIAKIQSKQTSNKQQFKAEVQKILEDELFAMTEFDDDDEKLCFYLRSRFIKVIMQTDFFVASAAKVSEVIMDSWTICVDGDAQTYKSCTSLLRANLIKAIATVEIAEAKADREFEKLPLHQKLWQFLQTFWK